MESHKLFQDRKIPPRRRGRPLWLVLSVAACLPGAGHLFLRNLPLAVGIFLLSFTTAAGAAVLSFFGFDHPAWLLGRASVLTALFSVVDATLGVAEQTDRRTWRRTDRPRLTVFLNLLTYGVGSWRQKERVPALVCIALGLALHAWLAAFNLPLAVLAELAVATMGYYGYRLAHDRAWVRPVSTELGEIEADAAPSKPVDTTPGWVMPALAGMCVLVVLTSLGGLALNSTLVEAMEVRQEKAVVMEPFYRNPEYGLSLEMNAPGWSFRHPERDEFVVAQHMAEDTQLRVSIQPRLPLLANDRAAAIAAVAEAAFDGYSLRVTNEAATVVGGQPGYRLWADGSRAGDPRRVMILTTGKGWRQYVFWFEWGRGHDEFARTEAAYVESTLSVEGGTPAGRIEGTTSPAR